MSGGMPIKPQSVRLLDVAVIGPVMILAALALPKERRALALTLAVFGVGTVAYNASNYLAIRKRGHE
jgi:hypothetical protein